MCNIKYLTIPNVILYLHPTRFLLYFILFYFYSGMDQTSCDRVEYMTDYFPKINFYMYQGPAPRIRTRNIPQDFFTCKYEGERRKRWKSSRCYHIPRACWDHSLLFGFLEKPHRSSWDIPSFRIHALCCSLKLLGKNYTVFQALILK